MFDGFGKLTLLDERLNMSPNGTDIASLYMDNGYLFFQVNPLEVAVIEDSIDIEIRVMEGPIAIINEVRISGNTKTKEYVIRRELRTIPGNVFSRSDLIRSQREIINLGYFDPEQLEVVPIPNPENGTVDIEYRVVEKPSDQLELSAGWGGRGRGVVGTLGVSFTNFSLQNMFKKGAWSPLPAGDGQRLSLRVQTNGRIYQSYNFSFTEPWLGGRKPNSLTVSYYNSRFATLSTDNKVVASLTTNGATIGIGTRLKWPDDYFTFMASLNFQSYKLDNWTSSNFIITDGRSNNLNMKFVLARSSVYNPTYPTQGSNISLSLQLTPPFSAFNNKDYTTMENNEKYKWVEYHKWRFTAEWFTPVTKNMKQPLVLRLAAKFGFLGYYNSDIGYSPFERYEIGGDGINRWYQVVVKEGRNREVRRIFESQSLKVSRLLRTRYGTIILPRELRTGRWMELDKTDIDNLAKSVELKPRQGTGLFGMAKRRTEKMAEKPLASRRGGYLRQQRRDDEQDQPQQRSNSNANNNSNGRKTIGFNKGFKKP